MSMVFKDLPTDKENVIVVGAIEVQFTYPDGSPVAGAGYELSLSSGGSRKGVLNAQGKLREANIPPGTQASVKLDGIPLLALASS
jgi:hypothetical protein